MNSDQIRIFPTIKNDVEIDILREGGKIWQKIRSEITPIVKPGVTGKEIEEQMIVLFDKYNVKSAFNTTKKFPGIICVSVNECVVHGLANNIPLKSGDKITLDVGFIHKKLFIDSAFTLLLDPESDPEYEDMIEKTLCSLWSAIKVLKPNVSVGLIAETIENYVDSNYDRSRYSIIDGFTGHGIGRNLHEAPQIYNKGMTKTQGVNLPPRAVICIEPMVLEQADGSFKIGKNGYDVLATKAKAKTAHWEHMVLFNEDGIEVLTATEEEIKKYYL